MRYTCIGMALSEREMQIIAHVAQGFTNNEIGKFLHLSEDTIKSHLHRTYIKLGARDRANAVAICYELELLTRLSVRVDSRVRRKDPIPDRRAS